MQTILGSNGQIGEQLARELKRQFDAPLRLVSRTPQPIHDTDELHPADLLDAAQTDAAVAGSNIVYLTAGLPMNTQLWVEQWPTIMRNVIRACQKHGAKLVFFDNTYMYPQTSEPQTEDIRFEPHGEKGRVRAEIAHALLYEMQARKIEAVICRAPEFYGPGKTQSITTRMIFDNIRAGKPLKAFVRDDTLRTLIYSPDASRAMALIGNTPEAFGQTWHLPCDDNRLTYRQLIELVCEVFGESFKWDVLKSWQIKMAGLANSAIRDAAELLPRYEQDNIFVSDKFKQAFPQFNVTTYREGITAIRDEITNRA